MKNPNAIVKFGFIFATLVTSAASWSASYPIEHANATQTFNITEARLYKPTRDDLHHTLFLDMNMTPTGGGDEKTWRLRIDTKTGRFMQETEAHSAAAGEIKAADLIEGAVFQTADGSERYLDIKMVLTPKMIEMAGPTKKDTAKAFGDGTSSTAVSIEGENLILNLGERN